jgi:NADPH:quinone reductase-like Zn-dependent oxidoreductase
MAVDQGCEGAKTGQHREKRKGHMKTVMCTKYGPPEVLRLKEAEKPSPKSHEVLIKIQAAPVTAMDVRIRGLNVPAGGIGGRITRLMMRLKFGLIKPKKPILGGYLAGEIEAAGKDVVRFIKGDQVYARTGWRLGAYAEYTCLPEDEMIALKPNNVNCEEAAAIPYGGANTLYFLRKGEIRSGQKVLIYGASGAIGTSAVQLARYFGADVTGVCSTTNLELVKSLGADRVIDYTKEDFTKRGELYDIIFDAVGKISCQKSKNSLSPNGKYISVFTSGLSKIQTEDLVFLKELVEDGELKPVIDRCYSLEQAAEAHSYVDKGHKKGNVVLVMSSISKD